MIAGNDPPRIVVAGAGAIGCFVGGMLALAGRDVVFLGRQRVVDDIASHGLNLTDFSGRHDRVASPVMSVEPAAAFRDAQVVLVTVKTAATSEIAELIAEHAPGGAMVVSLQNGLDAVAALRAGLPDRDVRAGMVPFNVVAMGQGRFHRATSGDIAIGRGPAALVAHLNVPGLPVAETGQIEALQWGKFLINLNNALNALSGLTLQQQLLDREWRRLMADQMAEAHGILRAHALPIRGTTPLPMRLVPHVLRLPTPLFSRIARTMLTIDPTARTSMAYDLMQGRPTEVEALQGRVLALAEKLGRPAPLTAAVMRAVQGADAATRMIPAEVRAYGR